MATDQIAAIVHSVGFPSDAPVLAGASLAVAALMWLWRRDAVAALIFGFSVFIPVFWGALAVGAISRLIGDAPEPMAKGTIFLFAEMAVVMALMVGCGAVAFAALFGGRQIENVTPAASVLIVAHTLHLHLIYTYVFMAASVPTWAYWLALALE